MVFLTFSAIKKTSAIHTEQETARKLPFASFELKSTENPWTIATPKIEIKIAKRVISGKRLFIKNTSINKVNSGAVVPSKVALEIFVSLTAEKKKAK